MLGSERGSFPFALLVLLALLMGAGDALEETGPEGVFEFLRRSALGPVGAFGMCFGGGGCARRSS